MANSYSQLYVHIVFTPKWRINLIKWADHIHIFIWLNPSISLSNLIKNIKQFSSLYINEQQIYWWKFKRQSWYWAFSHSQSQVETICNYIENQETHHNDWLKFKDEYLKSLSEFNINYNNKHVFEFYE